MKFPALVLFAVWFAGCGGSVAPSISASEFQSNCSVDTDCVDVCVGSLGCCGCGCPNAAINQASYPAYQSAFSAREPRCEPALPCPAFWSEGCRTGAVCTNGTCAFVQFGTDGSIGQ
jgi:hypothetical protein